MLQQTLVTSCVLSRIDYCNVLLTGCPDTTLQPLQKVQNSAARLITKSHRQQPCSPLLKKTFTGCLSLNASTTKLHVHASISSLAQHLPICLKLSLSTLLLALFALPLIPVCFAKGVTSVKHMAIALLQYMPLRFGTLFLCT